jgi:hypothetical protein
VYLFTEAQHICCALSKSNNSEGISGIFMKWTIFRGQKSPGRGISRDISGGGGGGGQDFVDLYIFLT